MRTHREQLEHKWKIWSSMNTYFEKSITTTTTTTTTTTISPWALQQVQCWYFLSSEVIHLNNMVRRSNLQMWHAQSTTTLVDAMQSSIIKVKAWRSKSYGVMPTYGNCTNCYKSGPLGKYCNECANQISGMSFWSNTTRSLMQLRLLRSSTRIKRLQWQQDGVNRLKNAMRWQCRRLHMEIPDFGEPT